MASQPFEEWVSLLMGPTPLVFLVTILVIISIPLALHFLIYRSSRATSLPSFLLIGPSGSGKTSLLTLFERGQHAETRTSQAPLVVECSLPIATATASSRYRSPHDPSNQVHKRFLLADTPGHGKLRYHATDSIMKPQNLVGIIFMVDAADLSSGSASNSANEALRQTAEYLHDILLFLQKRVSGTTSAKGPPNLPVLIAANKLDLFTALPAPLVKNALEKEISNVRSSKTKGLLDSGVGMNDMQEGRDWLGDGGDGQFTFSQMDEVNVSVKVLGGNATGTDGPDVKQWWDWIGSNL